jgi:homoserine dehydrogenase
MSSVITLGLIGFGNVGQGVHSILNTNADTIVDRIGASVRIKTICVRNIEKYQDIANGIPLTTNADDIMSDPEIDIVVELIGGEYPAYDYVVSALKHKKYVVTANKELIAKHKQTFFKLAQENGVDIYFEASVGGGIPIIKSFKVGYSANQIQSVSGILNGTTNFILTKLFEDKQEFNTVLKEAQRLGFAEADPTADISGLDAAYKIVILTAVALKVDIDINDIYYEGIEHVALKDTLYLDELGYRVRLIGKAVREPESVFVAVFPLAIPIEHPLATVRNEFNAIFSTGNMVGESMIYGKGAGSLPTGSAVMSDILDIAFNMDQAPSHRNLESNIQPLPVTAIDQHQSQFYCRILLKNQPGALERMSHVFSESGVNISQLIQKEHVNDEAEVVVLTDSVKEATFNTLKQSLNNAADVAELASVIRVGI